MRFSATVVAASLLIAAACFPATVWAEIGDYPLREVDRPQVLVPGLVEFEARTGTSLSPRVYDANARVIAPSPGSVTSAIDAEIAGRYGLFRGFEIGFRAPWTVDLRTKGSSRGQSGSGRARLSAAWAPPVAQGTDIALETALVFPTTARALRTDPAGIVHHDRLAVAASLRAKRGFSLDATAHAEGGMVFPFANADDKAADRNPPASFSVSAGSMLQLSDRTWADASAGFARTNRDRVSGGIVPRSDQFRVDLRPSAGITPTRWYDLGLAASIPVAGKNTPQAFGIETVLRARF